VACRGAKKVLVGAGSKSLSDCDAVLLPGINLDSYDSKKHRIISMGSCTTNVLAPVIKIVWEDLTASSMYEIRQCPARSFGALLLSLRSILERP
jgi:glyceraldehyde-3-phosphate dehydrogenase/erythrose-4-phosphate dehydrogenase